MEDLSEVCICGAWPAQACRHVEAPCERPVVGSFPPQSFPSGPTGGPALTFRPEEWRMVSHEEATFTRAEGEAAIAGLLAHSEQAALDQAMSELDREDALMSAVRAVARGS